MRRRVIHFVVCIIALITGVSFAANPIPSVPTPLAASSAAPQIWNLKNADIRAVIQTVSLLTGKTFLIDPRVSGKVTLVSQKPMTPDELYQVFLSMLHLLHFSAVEVGNVVRIVPAADANVFSRQVASAKNPGEGDEAVVRVFTLNHVSAMQMVPVLRPLMAQTSSVTAYLPSNALILAGSAGNINRLEKIIAQMDVAETTPVVVVHLRYANAKKVVEVINKLKTGNTAQIGGPAITLAADEEDNTILLNGNLANQLLMRNLIRQLDQPGAGGDDTDVVRLNYLSAKKIAPMLAKIATGISAAEASGSSATTDGKGDGAAASTITGKGDISVQAEESENAVVMHAPRSLLKSLHRVIDQLDHRPQEVLVEAIIVKIDENLLSKLGIVWGTPNTNTNSSTSGTVPASTTFDSSGSETPTSSASPISTNNVFAMQATIPTFHGIGFLPSGNLIALLHALKTNGSADVLSTPSVVVLNNEKALISDGQQLGMANRSYQGVNPTPGSTENIIAPYNTIQRQDVALSLNVTPHISPNNMIQLALKQEDDSVASGSDTTNPVINTSKINTSVLVRSGEILVLGGLIDNEDQKATQKLPILGDIPLIGRLFRYETHRMKKTSLMVFIRPVVMSKSMAEEQTMNRYKYIRHREIQVKTTSAGRIKMPMLPEIQQTKVILPQPVSSMDLPPPN